MSLSMFYTTFWMLLVSAQVTSSATHNGSFIGRTFSLTTKTRISEEETLDLTSILGEDGALDGAAEDDITIWDRGDRQNYSLHEANETWPVQHISDQARHFLTGPLSTVLMPSLYTLVCLVSVPLNAIAMVTFARQVRPVKPAVVFMANLAAADLLFALLLPFRIHYHFNGNDWVFGGALCRVVTASFYCNMHCSVLLIAAISADRLLAVVYPVRSLGWRRPRYAMGACGAAWALALAGSLPLTLLEQTVRLEELGITTCHDVQREELLARLYVVYFTVVVAVLFLLPMLTTLVCYARVIWALRRVPDQAGRNSRRKARATLMALVVLLLFLVCFAPTKGLLLLHYLQVGLAPGTAAEGSYVAYLVFLCVGSLNCCLDPLVYYFGSSQCQRQLSAALGCRRGSGRGGKNPYSSSECPSGSSSRTMLRSSHNGFSSVKAKPPVHKLDSVQAGLDSQYKKLLV